jgi:thioredoxin-related protein
VLSHPTVTDLINRRFVPVRMHVRDKEAFERVARRLSVQSTPTVLVLDSSGAEQHRFEGFVPREEFLAHLDPSGHR